MLSYNHFYLPSAIFKPPEYSSQHQQSYAEKFYERLKTVIQTFTSSDINKTLKVLYALLCSITIITSFVSCLVWGRYVFAAWSKRSLTTEKILYMALLYNINCAISEFKFFQLIWISTFWNIYERIMNKSFLFHLSLDLKLRDWPQTLKDISMKKGVFLMSFKCFQHKKNAS